MGCGTKSLHTSMNEFSVIVYTIGCGVRIAASSFVVFDPGTLGAAIAPKNGFTVDAGYQASVCNIGSLAKCAPLVASVRSYCRAIAMVQRSLPGMGVPRRAGRTLSPRRWGITALVSNKTLMIGQASNSGS